MGVRTVQSFSRNLQIGGVLMIQIILLFLICYYWHYILIGYLILLVIIHILKRG